MKQYKISEMRALLDAISPGGVAPEWVIIEDEIMSDARVYRGIHGIDAVCTMQSSNNPRRREQQRFIANAPQMIAQLLAEVESLRRRDGWEVD